MPTSAVLEQDTSQARSELRFSSPPADVIQDVSMVTGPTAQQAAPGPQFAFSAPPQDIVQDVQAVPAAASGLSAKPEADPVAPGLTDQQVYRIIRAVAQGYSGDQLYAAVEADPTRGLRFGLVLFDQASGLLGKVLEAMHGRDAAILRTAFGPPAHDLRRTLTAAAPVERMQPVGGKLLTEEEWKGRFRLAADLPVCQYAQNEVAIEELFRPMLPTAAALGLKSDRALAMFYDRVVALGPEAATRVVLEAISPLQTTQQQTDAIRRLGHDSVGAFQRSVKGLAETGTVGPDTHVEVLRQLRDRGDPSVPTLDAMLARMAQMSGPDADATTKLQHLRGSTAFNDAPLAL